MIPYSSTCFFPVALYFPAGQELFALKQAHSGGGVPDIEHYQHFFLLLSIYNRTLIISEA